MSSIIIFLLGACLLVPSKFSCAPPPLGAATRQMSLAQAPVAKHIWLALLLVSVPTSMQPREIRFGTIFSLRFKHRPNGGLPWHFDERRLLFALLPKHSAGNNFLGDRDCVKKVPPSVAPLFSQCLGLASLQRHAQHRRGIFHKEVLHGLCHRRPHPDLPRGCLTWGGEEEGLPFHGLGPVPCQLTS